MKFHRSFVALSLFLPTALQAQSEAPVLPELPPMPPLHRISPARAWNWSCPSSSF